MKLRAITTLQFSPNSFFLSKKSTSTWSLTCHVQALSPHWSILYWHSYQIKHHYYCLTPSVTKGYISAIIVATIMCRLKSGCTSSLLLRSNSLPLIYCCNSLLLLTIFLSFPNVPGLLPPTRFTTSLLIPVLGLDAVASLTMDIELTQPQCPLEQASLQ